MNKLIVKSFFSLLCISFIIIGCNVNLYKTAEIHGGSEDLKLKKNKIYEYTWYRYFGVGKDDTIRHEGTWERIVDTLVLNSYKTPNNYGNINILEEVKAKNDSITIFITAIDTSFGAEPISGFAPWEIIVDEVFYELKKPKNDTITLTIPNQKVKYIIIQGYPIYKTKNEFPSVLNIQIASTNIWDNMFGTYFFNEKFLMSNDTLYRLRNNQIEDYRFLIKSKKRGLK